MTMIELLVVITITAVLLALAAPSFGDASLSSKLSGIANRLSASALLARGEAIKRNAFTTLCMSADGTTCAASGGWEQGWVVLSGTTVLLHEQAAPPGYKVTETSASLTTLSFQPTGVGTTQADFTVCRATPYGRQTGAARQRQRDRSHACREENRRRLPVSAAARRGEFRTVPNHLISSK